MLYFYATLLVLYVTGSLLLTVALCRMVAPQSEEEQRQDDLAQQRYLMERLERRH